MFQIGKAVVSVELLETGFCCDLGSCKGMCCVYGDAGAPLEAIEIAKLEEIYPSIKGFMRQEGRDVHEKLGAYMIDSDGDRVTNLVDGKECIYTVFDKGKALCAIEQAFRAGKTDFQKPISCHLYPVRVTSYPTHDAVNYHEWEICKPARLLGKKQKLPLYLFAREALTRKFGNGWWETLATIAREHANNK